MNKKFFSLIHGDRVHIAPKTKVIPADHFSSLLDAREIIEHVKKDAEKYKIEVAQEMEKIKEQAQKDGFEAGYQHWIEEIAKLEYEITQVRKDTEKMILPVALKAAKKIVGREIEISDTAIVDIVSNCLKSVSTHKKIIIYVNKKDVEKLEMNRPQLKQVFENLEVLYIRERPDIEQGGCVIETEGGIINAKLENQWHTIENAFDSMMKLNELVHETRDQT